MTILQHKTAWREREQPYSRPRISEREQELRREVADAPLSVTEAVLVLVYLALALYFTLAGLIYAQVAGWIK